MKLKTVLSAVICSALSLSVLSGCNVIGSDADSLLRPPKSMGDEAEIEELISKTASNGYTLKYPKSGSYRSAIVMQDLDNDEKEEAIAFYRTRDNLTGIHMLVMYTKNDKWELSADFKVETTDIDCVDFTDINGDGISEILLGYSTYTPNTNVLTCYSYSNGKTTEIKSGQNYSAFYCGDFNTDGKNEVMTLLLYSAEKEANATMLQYNEEKNSLYAKATVKMDPSIVKFKNVSVTYVDKTVKGIVVDGEFANTEVNSQIIYYNDELSLLRNPLYSEKKKNITQRTSPVICTDTDKDGIIEIPVISKFPHSDKEPVETVADQIKWYSFIAENESYVLKSRVAANYNFNYSIKLTEIAKENTITALSQLNNNSMKFYEWNKNKLGNELFEIKVFSSSQWDEGKIDDTYTLIYKDNKYAYTYKIINKENQYSLTDDKIKTAFAILSETAV